MHGSHCPQCGALCEGDERFCTKCGASLASLTRCAECGAVLLAGARVCHKCGCPVGAYTSAPGTLAGRRTNLGLSIYNKLMLLLILWPSTVYWMDIFTISVREKSAAFGFMDFSRQFEWVAGFFRFFQAEDQEAISSILSAVKYLFILAAVIAAVRYVKAWIDSDNGQPVQVWRIVGCYVTPVVAFIAAAYIYLLLACQENEFANAAVTAFEVALLPSLHYVLAVAVPPVIGCFARPFFTRT